MLRPRHPAYLLVALIAASLLWYAATGKRRASISVRSTKANLTLVNMPSDLLLTSSVPDTVTLQLRGPLTLNPAASGRLEIFLDLAEAAAGRSIFPIDVSGVRLPMEVEVIAVEPTEIEIELERVLLRSLALSPAVEGIPAPGFMVNFIQVEPTRITIQGPESRLSTLDNITTSPISVEGATGSVEAVVTPLLSDPLLRSLTGSPVTVRVNIGPLPQPEKDPTMTPPETE
jgi:YbbR domain-containing protein